METLLEAGADVNAVAPNGLTALHRSASEGFQGVTEALLRGNRYDKHDLSDSSANLHHIRDTVLELRGCLPFMGFPLMTSRFAVITFPCLCEHRDSVEVVFEARIIHGKKRSKWRGGQT